ncbi:Uracil-regulated protein 1 [Rhizoclosmatium sp. JEL0117]|nr:Uracil-regulated protein 1 [Rhizoclosmatium sp. JEL0117]
MSGTPPDTSALLSQLISLVSELKASQTALAKQVESNQSQTNRAVAQLSQRVAEVVLPVVEAASPAKSFKVHAYDTSREHDEDSDDVESTSATVAKKPLASPLFLPSAAASASPSVRHSVLSPSAQGPIYTNRIVLTTYPGQAGVTPIPMDWGNPNPHSRGPIVCSRIPTSMKLRNAIGAHGGAYSIYRALAIAIRELDANHIPNLHNTEPVVKIGPYDTWNDPERIVSLDPWGHVVRDVFGKELKEGLDVRPTIAITKAHMKLLEVEDSVKKGKLKVDGKIVVNEQGDLMVTKGAVEPVWYLPGIAKRFEVDETTLRRCLFEDTGGMYPELITRPDLKVFLPPIGGLSIYIMGNPDYLSDPTKTLTLRIHDECNGSDVFGSDICTCRPYLIFGIEEAVKTAQQGGVGLIVYFRKEGRALGEVTKYLVYNARKRAEGGDTAKEYFLRTENIAGVKDMRFQATMPDVLHWLGIKKIDKMISMSNMKYDAIVGSGIPILERVPIPADMLPPDSQVEIDAKIASGYFSYTPAPKDLATTKGRTWDDVLH